AIGRWGNYFNQELYGRPTTLPWALEIDAAHRKPGFENIATYHPTFLYESLWCVGVALLLLWADRRFRLGGGRVFWLYVAAYTVGRAWIESLRVDDAHTFFGLRLNDYVSGLVFLVAVYMLYRLRGRHREDLSPVAVDDVPEAEGTEDEGTEADAAEPVARD
ncbi:MAG: prolipoprotein diacylglyceryl transferase, partial [Frankiales bacterium]|nr:prolipoprotein diacylglyceryl transferase [Frankiales bacterium]